MDRIVSGLFSVVATMAVVPIIRAPSGGAAELIAAKLDRKLRDHVLNNKESLFASSSTASRPLLVIVDRNADLNPMFSHSWIYRTPGTFPIPRLELTRACRESRLRRLQFPPEQDRSDCSKGQEQARERYQKAVVRLGSN